MEEAPLQQDLVRAAQGLLARLQMLRRIVVQLRSPGRPRRQEVDLTVVGPGFQALRKMNTGLVQLIGRQGLLRAVEVVGGTNVARGWVGGRTDHPQQRQRQQEAPPDTLPPHPNPSPPRGEGLALVSPLPLGKWDFFSSSPLPLGERGWG